MTFGDRLSRLRRENNLTQEQLAGLLGVSRQSVSKWESDAAYPETDKLIRLCELLGCTLDALVRGDDAPTHQPQQEAPPLRRPFRERKSERMLCGLPLWHVARDAEGFVAVGLRAHGVIAIGLRARGIISVGVLSLGLLSIGLLSLGLLAFGLLAIGLLSAGSFALGVIAAGSISLGALSFGAISLGDFSVGALAIGRYFAMGDSARAKIALGDSSAVGSLFALSPIPEKLTPETLNQINTLLREQTPSWLAWAASLVRLML